MIDDYLRKGQAAARDVWSPQAMASGMRDPRQLAGRLLQYATDLSSGWMDLVTAVMMNGGTPPGPTGHAPVRFDIDDARGATPPNGHHAPATGRGGATRLALEIRSARQVDVAVELAAPDGEGGLLVHDLRASGARKPRLTGIRLERPPAGGEGSLTLRLQVPAKHPPGTYRGAIVDADTSLPCGSLTVTIPG